MTGSYWVYSAWIPFVMVKTVLSSENLEAAHTIPQVASDVRAEASDGVLAYQDDSSLLKGLK